MQLTIILVLSNIYTAEAFRLGGVSTAIDAAKKFVTGTRKAKSQIHQTPLTNTAAGAVSVGQSDGIMKKSVDFLANSALLVGGVGSIYHHFAGDDETVSQSFLFILHLTVFYLQEEITTPAPATPAPATGLTTKEIVS